MTLSDLDKLVLSILQFRNGTLANLSKEAGLSKAKTQEILERLEVAGLIEREERNNCDHWLVTVSGQSINTLT